MCFSYLDGCLRYGENYHCKFYCEQTLRTVLQYFKRKKSASLLLGKLIYNAFRRHMFRQNLLVSKLLSTLVSLTMMLDVKNCYTYLFLFTFMEIHFESLSTGYFNDTFCLYTYCALKVIHINTKFIVNYLMNTFCCLHYV